MTIRRIVVFAVFRGFICNLAILGIAEGKNEAHTVPGYSAISDAEGIYEAQTLPGYSSIPSEDLGDNTVSTYVLAVMTIVSLVGTVMIHAKRRRSVKAKAAQNRRP